MKRKPYPLQRLMAVHPDALALMFDEASAPSAQLQGGVAVLDIEGPLEQRGGWWWQGYDQVVASAAEAFGRPEVWALVLRVSSPGGDVAGMLEASRQLRQLARSAGKPLVGYVDEEANSAAYCLISACDHIVVPPAGVVGSIGVVARIGDRVGANQQAGLNIKIIGSGRYKGELHPDQPLTPETVKRVEDEVGQLAQLFAELVAEHRPQLTARQVLDLEADTFRGQDAVAKKLADQVGTWPTALDVARRRADAARTTKTTAARPSTPWTAMNREQLIKFLGLAADATDAQINEALAARAAIDDQIKALAGASTMAEAVGKLGASAARLATFEASAKETEKKNKETAAEREVGQLVASERLQPSLKAFALGIHGTAAWEPFVKALPAGKASSSSAGADGGKETKGEGKGAGQPPEVSASRHRFDASDRKLLNAWGLPEDQAADALERHSRGDFAVRPRDPSDDEETV